MTQFEFVLVSSLSNISGSGTNRPISRYCRHYGSKVNRSIEKRKQDVIAFVNTVTQFIHRGSYAHIVTVVRKFSWICWL